MIFAPMSEISRSLGTHVNERAVGGRFSTSSLGSAIASWWSSSFFFGDGTRTHTLVMTTVPHQVRFIDTIHAKNDPHVKIRF